MISLLRPQTACIALLAFALFALGLGNQADAASSDNGDIEVLIDEATLLRLDRTAAEIIVGNPSIADVSVQSGKMLVVTGKSFGQTNLIVIDADGKAIINKKLSVQEPRQGLVTLYRGSARFSFYCAPNCTPPLVIGDEADHFDKIEKQIQSKRSIGQSSAEGSASAQ